MSNLKASSKILILTGSVSRETGGMHSYLFGLCEALFNSNIDFELCIHDGQKVDQRFNKFLKNIKSFNFYFYQKFYFSPSLFFHVLTRNYSCVYLHGSWASTSILTLLKFFIHGTKYIVVPHGMYCGKLTLNKRIALLWEMSLIKHALFIQALNTVEFNCIKVHFPNSNVRVIYPGLNVNDSVFIDKGLIDIPKNYFLYIGQLHKRKNLLNLIKAWKIMVNSYNFNYSLVIAGFGDSLYTKSVLSEIDGSSQIIYLGSVFGSQKELLFKNAKCSLLFSHSEGLPTSLLESVHFNTPILCSKNCNVSDLFESLSPSFKTLISSGTGIHDICNVIDSFLKMTDDENLSYIRSLSLDFTQKINWQETVKLFYNEN